MLDVRFIYENKEFVKKAVQAKNDNRARIDLICECYEKRKCLQIELDNMRQKLNESSEMVSKLKKEGGDPANLIEENRKLREAIQQLESKMREYDSQIESEIMWVPNPAAKDVPVSKDSSGNVIVRTCGEHKSFDFTPRTHVEIGEALDIIDFKRSSKLSGSHFILLKKEGALLERSLINFMLDLHTKKHGYKEIWPPYLATRDCMVATGHLPKFEQDMYNLEGDDLFLIPTAEVPLTNLYGEEVLSHEQLPVYLCSYTACFRREAGAYGQETKGLIRVHQFDKVELVKLTHPDRSFDELERLVNDAEEVLKALELEYRVVLLSTADLSFASAKTYDIEAWAPGIQKWLEVSSCSNFCDFQARRAGIRFRDADGKLKFVHTLNGSGIALPRTLIALIENYQQYNGSVIIPDALRPYMGGLSVLKSS